MNKKLLTLIMSIVGAIVLLSACSSPYVQPLSDGQQLFISNDNLYEFTVPGDWKRDQNTIINGATIAGCTEDGESQCLYVKPEKRTFDAQTGNPTETLEKFADGLLTSIKESTANCVEISHEKIQLGGNPTIAIKLRHTVGDYDTISWLYCMELDNQFLRINAYTYHPDVEENSTVIEQVLNSFVMVPQDTEKSEQTTE